MKKTLMVLALIVSISLLVLAGCTKSQPSGYATYQGQQQGQQGAIGGGCGVAAPSVDTKAAEQVGNTVTTSA